MPSKAPHTKSRHSCSRCKVRRVKCDLRSPCGHCQRRGEKCSLRHSATQMSAKHHMGGYQHSSTVPVPTSTSQPRIQPQDHFAFLSLFIPSLNERPPPGPLKWTEDLFLMSHFTSSTSYTLSHREADQRMWRITVPEMATVQPFLMHGLLAVSAMHLSHIRSADRNRYETQSSYHQALATSQLRSVLANLSPENCSAAFGLCALLSLISMISIARRSDAERTGSGTSFVDDIIHHFMLTRGIGGVLADYWTTIMSGPLKILSTDRLENPEAYPLPPHIDEQFSALRHTILPLTNSSDAAALETCIAALDGLELVYKNMLFLHPHLPRSKLEVGVALRWMSLVPVDFITLLRDRNPMTLILMAHFVVLFANFGDLWFLQDWCEHALIRIEAILEDIGSEGMKWPWNQVKEITKHTHG